MPAIVLGKWGHSIFSAVAGAKQETSLSLLRKAMWFEKTKVSGTIVRTDGWRFWQALVPDTVIHFESAVLCRRKRRDRRRLPCFAVLVGMDHCPIRGRRGSAFGVALRGTRWRKRRVCRLGHEEHHALPHNSRRITRDSPKRRCRTAALLRWLTSYFLLKTARYYNSP